MFLVIVCYLFDVFHAHYKKQVFFIVCSLISIQVCSCASLRINSEYDTNTASFLTRYLIDSYRTKISRADGPRSGSFPTGSAYGREAFLKYGSIRGFVLTSSRLLQESEDERFGSIIIGSSIRKYDPLDFNTYWWDEDVKERYTIDIVNSK